jgi:RNA polymerase sigma-70 factor (ECF subfamily)
MERTEEAAVIARTCRGDQAAFGQLVEEHRGRILRVCLRLMGNVEDAKDVAQEVFLQAYLGLDRFRGGARFQTWLYRIAVNRCLNARRDRGRSAEALDESIPDPEPTPDRVFARRELRRGIDRALERLSPELRAAVVLRDCLGCSYVEIAEVLDVPLGTVKSRIAAGRWALRGSLEAADEV